MYAANGFRCPLTDVAERLGAKHGSVADIYLPRWIESHLPFITGPIFAAALIAHAKNAIASRRPAEPEVSLLAAQPLGPSAADQPSLRMGSGWPPFLGRNRRQLRRGMAAAVTP